MNTESIKLLCKSIKGNLNELKELTINRFNIDGELQIVDLTDLNNIPNIEALTLVNLDLNDQDIDIITNLKQLRKISLINCELEDSKNKLSNLELKELYLDNTYLQPNMFSKIYQYIEIKNMSLVFDLKAVKLNISQAEIDLDNFNYQNINILIISDKQYQKYEYLFKKNNLGIKLIVKDKYDEVIKEYENV